MSPARRIPWSIRSERGFSFRMISDTLEYIWTSKGLASQAREPYASPRALSECPDHPELKTCPPDLFSSKNSADYRNYEATRNAQLTSKCLW